MTGTGSDPNATGQGDPAQVAGDPAASAGADPAAGAGASVAAEATPGEAPSALAPSQTVPIERFRAVIGQRAEKEAQLLQARRELELANQTIAEFRKLSEASPAQGTGETPAAPARTPARAPTPAEIERLVAEEAARRDFTRQCNEAFQSGKEAHADFEKVIADLNALSPVFDPRLQRPVMPQSLVEAALATGNAHEVLYALGKDNGLADRVLAMPPMQQAAELTRLSMKLAGTGEETPAAREQTPSVSRAPAPVKPKVTGSGTTAPVWDPSDTERFSTQEWIAKREADLKRQREAARH